MRHISVVYEFDISAPFLFGKCPISIAFPDGFITVSALFADGWPGGISTCLISHLKVKFSFLFFLIKRVDRCHFFDAEDCREYYMHLRDLG